MTTQKNLVSASKLPQSKQQAGEFRRMFPWSDANNDGFGGTFTVEEKIQEERNKGVKAAWDVVDTPLKKYTFKDGWDHEIGARFRFDAYLIEKLSVLGSDGDRLRVLDVGVSTGKQWIDFLHSYQIEFHGTSLSGADLHPEIRNLIKVCSAAELHKNFPPDYFHVIVSHYGTHKQERVALENALWVLRPGGEVVVSGDGGRCPPIEEMPNYRVYFELNAIESYHEWFYWIKKREK